MIASIRAPPRSRRSNASRLGSWCPASQAARALARLATSLREAANPCRGGPLQHRAGTLSFQVVLPRVGKMVGKDRGAAGAFPAGVLRGNIFVCFCVAAEQAARSEEHTSELQSLMRISYAVFCL